MISVSGSVMIATSPIEMDKSKRLPLVRNADDACVPKRRIAKTAANSPVSQRWNGCASSRAERRRCETAAGPASGAKARPLLQSGGELERDGAVERDRAEGGPDDAAAAAEDRDAADDDGRDHLELVAAAGGGVERPVVRAPKHSGQAGDRAADGEGGEHPSSDRDAGQARRVRVRPDRVQLAAGTERAQVERSRGDDRRDHDREIGNAVERLERDLDEGVRERARHELPAADDQDVDAANDVERGECDHEARHPADHRQRDVHDSAREPDADADQEHDGDGDSRVMPELVGRDERRQPHHGADRKVDVPRDDHHRLAEREQREDRGVLEDEVDLGPREVAGLDTRRHDDEDRERGDDAERAEAEDEVDEPARARAAGGRQLARDRVDRGRHAALSASWPVAAATIFSSVASACASSATRRPSRMTMIRSATRSTSGSSDEIISTATPWPASSSSSRCTSAFVPMSMPRVGSSTIRSDGFRPSHFASTTFCWLPPDSDMTVFERLPYLSCSRSAQSRANLRSLALRMKPRRRRRLSDASAMLRAIDISITSPCWRRSSGTKPMPAAIAAVGDARRSRRPPTVTVPAS